MATNSSCEEEGEIEKRGGGGKGPEFEDRACLR